MTRQPTAEMCAPCECSGTIRYIHVTCLKEWIKEKKSVMCELYHTEYRKKWKDWANSNNILSKAPAQASKFEASFAALKVLLIFFVSFWFVMICIMMVQSERGVHSTRLKGPEKFVIYSTFFLIVFGYIYTSISFFGSQGFKNRIEMRVQSMFPRSNNLNYANDLKLPVKNKIAT